MNINLIVEIKCTNKMRLAYSYRLLDTFISEKFFMSLAHLPKIKIIQIRVCFLFLKDNGGYFKYARLFGIKVFCIRFIFEQR